MISNLLARNPLAPVFLRFSGFSGPHGFCGMVSGCPTCKRGVPYLFGVEFLVSIGAS